MSERLEIKNNLSGNTPPSLAARISLACIGLLAVLPFLQVHHAYPMPGFYTEFVAFALGLLGLTLLLYGRYWRNLALPWIVFAPLGLFAVLLLQLNLKMPAYYETQVIALLYLVWVMLLIILGAVLRREFGLTAISTVLAWFFLAGGELNALAGIIQHYDIKTFLDDFIAAKNSAAVFGNVAQTNHFANHISLALASLAFLFATDKLRTWMAVPLALPLLFVLALSSQRSPWLYLLTLLILALLLLRQGKINTGKYRLVTASFLLIAGFALAQWLVHTPLFAAPMGTITAADRMFEQAGGTAIRLYYGRLAWEMFLQAPLMGVGFGEFAWHHFQLMAAFPLPENAGLTNNSHNLIMQLLAETGLAGTLPIIVGIAIWLFGLRRSSFDFTQWWLLTLLAIIGIHSLLEFPLWYGHFLGLAAFLFGLGETRFLPLQLPRLGRLAMLLVLTLSWGVMVTIEQDYHQLESTFPAKTSKQKYLSQDNIDILQALHRKTLLSPYVDFALASAMELNQDKLDLKLTVNQRVMHFIPNGQITYKQSILLALNGNHAAAIKQAENAVAAYPGQFEKFAETLDLLETENSGIMGPLMEWTNTRRRRTETGKQ